MTSCRSSCRRRNVSRNSGRPRVRQLHPQQWRERAACRGIDLDVFVLPPSLTSGSAPPATLERLQADADATIERYCAGCPVITACRDAAIDEGDTDAIRGGMTPRQRRAWVKARKAHHARGLALLNELRKVSA